jgi:hypothetical protein
VFVAEYAGQYPVEVGAYVGTKDGEPGARVRVPGAWVGVPGAWVGVPGAWVGVPGARVEGAIVGVPV